MSMRDRARAAVLAHLMMAADGALFGIGVAYVAYRSFRKYTATSSALRRIRNAPSVSPSDLRSVLADDSHPWLNYEGGKLVVARGSVEVSGNWKSSAANNTIATTGLGEEEVISQETRTYVYNDWKGISRWTADLRDTLSISSKQHEISSSTSMVPFILVDGDKWPHTDYLAVNMEGSNHPLPLTTAFQHFDPISSSPSTLLLALCGVEYPVGVLYQEKILPVRKDITAVGIFYPKDGNFEIRSCKDLPFFLSALTKDQLVADLSSKMKVLMWYGLVFGTVAVGILGYSVARNWSKWKAYRQRQQHNSNTTTSNVVAAEEDEESEEIPDGELCVVCLMRRRRSAFIPCGHRVCCQPCALAVGRDATPKCPLCRQTARTSVRVYDS